jgi:eukaryotic-like serine/threonine-protein kinase
MEPHSGVPDLIIGQTIGNYLVTQKLGEGGMGSVYLAEHPHIGKKVALKVLHAEFSSNEEVVSRFFHEAKAVNDIQHPNIVDIVDYGVLQHGAGHDRLVYFIMEYLAGGTLSQLIRNESPLPPERTFAIALQVADALAASHRCSIVHRDLKPDNIILGQRGRERDFVKLLDFGIAKLTGDQPGSRRTRAGIVMGTPAYMSPEQCDGRGAVDHRTDIYAMGIVLYEMLVGRVPFLGEGYGEVLVQHLTQPPVRPSQFRMLSPHVEAVVLKALEKRPDMRYPTMEDMMRALADPVGYVEANGGLQGFARTVLQPSNGPISVVTRMPQVPTPHPGSLSPISQIGHLSQLNQPGYYSGIHSGIHPNAAVGGMGTANQPTTLGASVGARGGDGRKMGMVAVAVIAVAAVAITIVLAARGGSEDKQQLAMAPDAALPDAALVVDALQAVAVDAALPVDAAPSVDAPQLPDAPPPMSPKVTFTIRSEPSGATVKIVGKVGKTPYEVTLDRSLGVVDYNIELSGYFPRKDRINLTLRELTVPTYQLDKKRSGGGGGGSGRPNRPKNPGDGSGSNKPGSDTDLMRP